MFFSELFPNSLQPIHRKRQVSREATDFITLDLINREENLPQWARDRMPALLKHIKDNKNHGSQFRDLREVLLLLSRDQVKKILAEMKRGKMICVVGKTSAARWYPDAGD